MYVYVNASRLKRRAELARLAIPPVEELVDRVQWVDAEFVASVDEKQHAWPLTWRRVGAFHDAFEPSGVTDQQIHVEEHDYQRGPGRG